LEKVKFECSNCSYVVPKWLGNCLKCNSWNSFVEKSYKSESKIKKLKLSTIKKLCNIKQRSLNRLSSEIMEFDRVMGGGIVQGSLTLVGGEPGVGKSTLLLEMVAKVAKSNKKRKVLYISGEESESQVALRAKRLNINAENIYIMNESYWEKIKLALDEIEPIFFVLDSIQTTKSIEVKSPAGSISQIKEVTYEIINYCKEKNLITILIGHITKDGAISGPKLLEHMVDTVLYFEGINDKNQRLLRSIKNRFGSTEEIGFFEMSENGLNEIKNSAQYFIEQNYTHGPGRSTTCISEGSSVLFIEVQALVNENKYSNNRRTTQGIDTNRLSMLIAIIEKFFEISLMNQDIFINIIGGIKIDKREIDLSIVASILSSYYKKALDRKILFLGEVGLSGEIRSTPMIEARLKEISLYDYEEIILGNQDIEGLRQKFNIKISTLEKIRDLKKYFF